MNKWIQACLELLYPSQCQICDVSLANANNKYICDICLSKVDFIKSPLCVCCGKQLSSTSLTRDRKCGVCLAHKPIYKTARAFTLYSLPISNLLHRLKYNGDISLIPLFRSLIENSYYGIEVSSDYLILPVPLHPSRLRERGFNQSQLLAKLFFPASIEKIKADVLVRIRNTVPQTTLNGIARRNNLKGAFFVHPERNIKSKKIYLVDDVYTTGTTANECCKVLLSAGASEVHIITMSRAQF